VIALVRAEFLKIRTTNIWWLLLIGLVVTTGLALVVTTFTAADAFQHPEPPQTQGLTPEEARAQAEQLALKSNLAFLVANIYTSGQYFGLLLAMVIGILIVTNEFFHQTATPTFLTTPRRSRVIAAKLGGAASWGIAFGLVTTVISGVTGVIFLNLHDKPLELGNPDVTKAILLNLMAFGIWATFGLGLGTLLKNQIAAIVVALVLYLIADSAVQVVLFLLANRLHEDWILNVAYYLPSGASKVMTAGTKVAAAAPEWWGGALILLAYGAVTAGIGTLITVRRDIS
jgi:ABC-2 type transport system permease protein